MIRIRIGLILLFVVVVMNDGEAVYAGFFNSASGLASPGDTVTFSEVALADGTLVSSQYAAEGVTFSTPSNTDPTLFFDNDTYGGGFPNMTDEVVHGLDLPESPPNVPLLIKFADNVSEAAFALYTKTGTATNQFDALLNGSVVETASVASDATETDNFYGFSGITFNAIRLTVDTTTNGFFIIDNIQFTSAAMAPVPEPASIVLWAGIAGIGFVARRRRNRAG